MTPSDVKRIYEEAQTAAWQYGAPAVIALFQAMLEAAKTDAAPVPHAESPTATTRRGSNGIQDIEDVRLLLESAVAIGAESPYIDYEAFDFMERALEYLTSSDEVEA